MDKQELIDMLNRDLADEHAAIIRYLVHGYMEGEDMAGDDHRRVGGRA
jgi:bacterioferritin